MFENRKDLFYYLDDEMPVTMLDSAYADTF